MDYLFVGTRDEPYISSLINTLQGHGHQTRFANAQEGIEALPTNPDAIVARPCTNLESLLRKKPGSLPAIVLLDTQDKAWELMLLPQNTTVLYISAIFNISERVLALLPQARL